MPQHARFIDDLYVELSAEGFGHAFAGVRELHRETTPFQSLKVLDTASHGRLLLLDDLVMLTDRDEWIYHEMIAHVPLLLHPKPERVLVVGGGDGGTIREVLRHDSVKEAVLCEIDGRVIDVCREWFPRVAGALDDPRVTVHVGDGVEYMRGRKGEFDVILVDSTDPVGPAEGLFQSPFFLDVRAALREGGLYCGQTESPFMEAGKLLAEARAQLGRVFPWVDTYWAAIPVYPFGLWTFSVAGLHTPPSAPDGEARMAALAPSTRYWTPALQKAAFALPAFALKPDVLAQTAR